MPSDQQPAERLRTYLRELKPEARALLLAELERGALSGDDVPGSDLILRELRRMVPPAPPAGLPSADRLFFAPIEPFVIVDNPGRKHRGRVAQSSLAPVWQWICRDLAADDAKTYVAQVSQLLAANDRKTADQIVRAFQDRIARYLREQISRVARDDKARRRLGAQIGTPKALDEVREVCGILTFRDTLSLIASRLPSNIGSLADEQLDNVKALLDSPTARHDDVFTHAVLLVMSRLGAPWQLVRLAVRAAGTDDADRVEQTGYAVAVAVVLSELEAKVWRLRAALKGSETKSAAALLKDIHDTTRGLRTEINLSADCAWARKLAAFRSEVSELIEGEIESIPGRVRRLLRPRPSREIAPDSTLDPADIDETEAAIELVGTCRNYAGELAINEVTLRVHSDLQSLLDTGTSALLDALRNSADSDCRYRGSQADAAVRFAAKVFGPNYASLLAKATDVARADRKVAKA